MSMRWWKKLQNSIFFQSVSANLSKTYQYQKIGVGYVYGKCDASMKTHHVSLNFYETVIFFGKCYDNFCFSFKGDHTISHALLKLKTQHNSPTLQTTYFHSQTNAIDNKTKQPWTRLLYCDRQSASFAYLMTFHFTKILNGMYIKLVQSSIRYFCKKISYQYFFLHSYDTFTKQWKYHMNFS